MIFALNRLKAILASLPLLLLILAFPTHAISIEPLSEVSPVKVVSFGDVFFDFNNTALRDSSKEVLQTNAEIIIALKDAVISIQGHADQRGTTEYNLVLGEQRAKAVLRYLIAEGVDESKIKTISYGEEQPQCNQNNENCRQQNRRVHFIVEKLHE